MPARTGRHDTDDIEPVRRCFTPRLPPAFAKGKRKAEGVEGAAGQTGLSGDSLVAQEAPRALPSPERLSGNTQSDPSDGAGESELRGFGQNHSDSPTSPPRRGYTRRADV